MKFIKPSKGTVEKSHIYARVLNVYFKILMHSSCTNNVMLKTYLSGSIKSWSHKQMFKSLNEGLEINIKVESKNSLFRLLSRTNLKIY